LIKQRFKYGCSVKEYAELRFIRGSKRKTGPKCEEIKLIIRKFKFDGDNLSVLNALEPDKNIDQDLPVIAMDDLGAAKGGATGKEIAREMIRSLASQVAKAAIQAGVNNAVVKRKEDMIERTGEKINGLFNK
jgi:hypothetical protein